MRNPQPIVARLVRGPLAGQTHRVKQDQAELRYDEHMVGQCGKVGVRTHVYRIKWPASGETAAVLLAHYAGTRRR